MMRLAIVVPALVLFAVGSAPLRAQPAPDPFPMGELERLKACFDKNLADLVPSGEPIATISKAIEVICEEDIQTVARKMLRDAIVERGKRISTREADDGERFLKDKVRSLLLAYGLRFKAKGGPTTLTD
ncbi:hypothetical protein [Methylobacterium sp. J-090]|uniref:hypothetical protein n=1 Tax=Methylobacterium sp. J-090 TaxID=2836666 RepID=UPI001FB9C7FA|nr:hypothetical protein [Methylobacterium sp. J-090]MCJ2079833.1 hypothetical protein [Methylobacterium sp. J-090]